MELAPHRFDDTETHDADRGFSEHVPDKAGRSGGAGRLIAVSNRVVPPDQEHVGGLGQALKSAFARTSGVWIGWSGRITESPRINNGVHGSMEYVTTDLNRACYNHYYRGFSNRVMWPLLHGRLDLMDFEAEAFDGYMSVNGRFADQLAANACDDDAVWVHDYHLIPLAALARAKGVRSPIGFFLHTPVPAATILAALPRHHELLGTLAAYDLVGVQTLGDAINLREYFKREHGGKIDHDGSVRLRDGRVLQIGAFPIGIDPKLVSELAVSEAGNVRDSISGDARHRMIGVDRLDYSKGIPERLRAIELLLDRQPDLAGSLRYTQIAPTSRGDVPAYQQLARQVGDNVARINGRFTRHGIAPPIECVRDPLPLRTLAGLYRRARVGLVTPLRDGMNLVAKEYVAAQDPLDPGVLVLSSFAGAACELSGALLVNPYDVGGMADTIGRALAMQRGERRERWHAMMDSIRSNDIHAWGRRFVDALRGCGHRDSRGAGVGPEHRAQRLSAADA